MILFERLRLVELLREGDVRTYLTAETNTGHAYLLHWLPLPDTPESALVKRMLDELPENSRNLIIESGESDGRPYVITQNPPSFTDLESWLQEVKDFLGTTALDKKGIWKIPVQLTEPSSRVTDAAGSEPGEFTRFLQGRPFAPAPLTKDAAAEPMAKSPAPAEEGEFTRLMQPRPSPQRPATAPGEFTRLMQAQELSAPAKSDPPQPSAMAVPGPEPRRPETAEPGEFTRMFMPQVAAVKEDKAPQQPVSSGLPGTSQPGEFTRLFRPLSSQPTPLLPKEDPFSVSETPAIRAGDFGDYRQPLVERGPQRPSASPGATQAFHTPAPPQVSEARAADGPSDYTRLFSKPLSAEAAPGSMPSREPAPPISEVAEPPEPRKKSNRDLEIVVAVLTVLAIAAIVLILYFATRK